MNELSWKLYAPLSVEGQTLLVERQEFPAEMAVRLGGAAGIVLKAQEAQEFLLHLLTGESWVNNRLVWAAPRLHIGQKGYNLSERARLALIEALQALLVDVQGLPINPPTQNSWQRTILHLSHASFGSLREALPQLGEAALNLLGVQCVSLWLKGERELKLAARYPQESVPDEAIRAQKHPIYLTILERNLVLAVDNVHQDTRLGEVRSALASRNIQSVLQVVFHGDSGPQGVLSFESHKTRSWTKENETVALALASLYQHYLQPVRTEAPRFTRPAGAEGRAYRLGRPEFEAYLSQALLLAQRYGRSAALIRVRFEGLAAEDHELAARELASALRQSDSLAAWGDDGYALLLSEINWQGGASRVGHRLLQKVRNVLPQVKTSLGIAVFPQDAGDATSLWQQAEKACTQASELGGGIRLLTPGADVLEDAISKDALTLHFQPILQLSDLELVAVEALTRWPRVRGVRMAGEFMPLMQQAGLITHQDTWVVERVVEQAALWRPSGVNARFSLNVSAETLSDPSFPGKLQSMLAAKFLGGEILVLEVREEAILSDLEAASRSLVALKQMDVIIALDDFGTNPLPLAQLKRLPVSWFKLSPSLLSAENAQLAKVAIDTAHAVGAKAVAKGLEEQAQLTRMRELGCDLGQGHLLGWPVPAEDLGALLVWGVGS